MVGLGLRVNYKNPLKSPIGPTEFRPSWVNTPGDVLEAIRPAIHPAPLAQRGVQLSGGGGIQRRDREGRADAGFDLWASGEGQQAGADKSKVPKMSSSARMTGENQSMWTVIGYLVVFIVGLIVGMILGFLAFAPDKDSF